MEIDGLYDGEWNEGSSGPAKSVCIWTRTYRCSNLCELVTTIDSGSADDLWKRFLCTACRRLTRERSMAQGKAYADLCRTLNRDCTMKSAGKLAEEAGVAADRGREFRKAWKSRRASRRTESRYVFVQNFNREAVEIKLPIEQLSGMAGNSMTERSEAGRRLC